MHVLNMLKHLVSAHLVKGKGFTGDLHIDKSLEKTGCAVIPNFLSGDICKALVERASVIIQNRPDVVTIESNNSDNRVYGIDTLDGIFDLTNETILLNNWARNFYKTNNIKYFQMLGHIRDKKNNLGSGGGWHRDSPFSHQFKFIIYLTDVDKENGPFQYISGTHKEKNIFKYSKKTGISLNKYRFTEDQIEAIIANNPECKIETILGKAGTLMVADVKGIHRGMPILAGERWATTRYYFKNHIPEHLARLVPVK